MFACIHVPDFAVQAALRDESQTRPVALLDGPESLLKVVACNQAARRAGVATGMTKLQGEVCDVTLRKRMQENEDCAQAALLDCAYRFSPRVEITRLGTTILDLAGSERLLGDDRAIATLLKEQFAQCGFECNAGMAANPDAADCAARGFSGVTIIDEGEEAERLGHLPIEVLELAPDVLDLLHAWGIRDFRSLAALPTIPLSERLGQYGLHLQRLAQGLARRELVPAGLPAVFRECAELEEAVDLLEPLSFILNRLLERLTRELIEKSLATDRLEIELSLEVHSDRDIHSPLPRSTDGTYRRTVKLPVPTQDAKLLLKLAQLDLAAHPPHAAVKKVAIEAMPARIRYTQTGLFQPHSPEPAKLEVTMARIRAVIGEADAQGRERVGFACLLDSLRPDHFQVGGVPAKHIERAELPAPCYALHRFRPPIAARVEVSAEQVPIRIGFSQKNARVVNASGPWSGGGDWWDAAARWRREEWDVDLIVDGQRAHYRIFRDMAAHRWFVEGMYD